MAKLILSMDGLVLKEINLTKERTTIGRKPHNDIQIDNLAVSGEHAVIVTILQDSFLEDLGSTNGTFVNGKRVKTAALKSGDKLSVGRCELEHDARVLHEVEVARVGRAVSRREARAREGAAELLGEPGVALLELGERPRGGVEIPREHRRPREEEERAAIVGEAGM